MANNPVGNTSPHVNAQSERRRSSATQHFASLQALKRNSQHTDGTQRRASMMEQQAKPGMLGQMWNKFTRGSG
ncbi:hypothetical protein BDY21DRAFT_351606 [Lineolata rhizophorae]|uniref:Conidiation-specific expression protein n=1 Tax=Lineolata rhizophorae TaxID=578093 RepID=A0A6A6NST2_9PEZI|nr:hypothetical protein BDY21DRAFT_351606 [Lineolata rhizophorae]